VATGWWAARTDCDRKPLRGRTITAIVLAGPEWNRGGDPRRNTRKRWQRFKIVISPNASGNERQQKPLSIKNRDRRFARGCCRKIAKPFQVARDWLHRKLGLNREDRSSLGQQRNDQSHQVADQLSRICLALARALQYAAVDWIIISAMVDGPG